MALPIPVPPPVTIAHFPKNSLGRKTLDTKVFAAIFQTSMSSQKESIEFLIRILSERKLPGSPMDVII